MVFSATGLLGAGRPCFLAYSARAFAPPATWMMSLTLMLMNRHSSLKFSELQDEKFGGILRAVVATSGAKP